MMVAVESEGGDPPVTTLTGILDHAALQGLLRRQWAGLAADLGPLR
jgi:hypothetical protein